MMNEIERIALFVAWVGVGVAGCGDDGGSSGAVCGNNQVEDVEQCDDGNRTNGDGCASDCRTENGVCGNGTEEAGEECDDGNVAGGDGCDAQCQSENPICGDADVEGDEQCDDGNTAGGDGCSASCQREAVAESEPNDDEQVASQTNDFSSANSQGPYTADTLIKAAISPSGDDDCFAVQNAAGSARNIRFETFGANGPGSCGFAVRTRVTIRDSGGAQLATNDDGGIDSCSLVMYTVPSGVTVYVHVTEVGDQFPISSYHLDIDFP